MEPIKKTLFISALVGIALVASAALVQNGAAKAPLLAENDPQEYQLDLSQLSASNKTLITPLGNEIRFEVSGFDGSTMSPGGYIYNLTPISGLLSISYSGGSHALSIDYGWECPRFCSQEVEYLEPDDSLYFDGEPTYFYLYNHPMGDAVSDIAGLTLSYSCQRRAENPDVEYDFTFQLSQSETEYYVAAMRNYDQAIVPSVYKGLPVTRLLNGCGSFINNLERLVLPSSIDTIEHSAYSHSSFQEVCFCTDGDVGKFLELEIDKSLPKNFVLYDGDYKAMNDIVIPEGTVSLGKSLSFLIRQNAISLRIPSSVTSCPSSTKVGCKVYVEVDQNNNFYSFLGDLQTAYELHFVDSNGDEITAFEVPSDISSLEGTFHAAKNIVSIALPEGLQNIGDSTFLDCKFLESIDIPSTVTSIGDRAFERCDALTSIAIPTSVNSIASYAFWDCDSLTTIEYEGTMEQWNAISKGSYIHGNDVSIVCTDGVIEA